MSEQEQQDRPLTRRELRERAQAAVQAESESAAKAQIEVDELETVDIEVEISPYHEDGSLRSRRELRELHDAEVSRILAERRAAVAEPAPAARVEGKDEVVGSAEAVLEDEALEPTADEYDAYSAPTEPFSAEDLREAVGDQGAGEPTFDDAVPPTEAFSLSDLLDAVEPTAPTGDADAVATLFADEDAEHPPSVAVPEESASQAEPEGRTEPEGTAEPDEAVESENEDADTANDSGSYSFPDIQPPEEWRSVFDDPSRAAAVGNGDSSGDFDDLISRAVAHEGHTGRTGTSALILPSHPGETGGLAGPLGMTGELYVTGSIELPKSIGETGGHAALHDSADLAFLTGEQPAPIASGSEAGPVPVSAMNAVSARRRPEIPVVAEPTKDRSKLPLVLSLSGGGLIVVVVGVAIYAATQGWFA